MNPDWARELRDACAEAGVLFHFKQFGSWGHDVDFVQYNRDLRAGRLDKRRFRVWHTPDGKVASLMRYAGPSPNAGGKLLDGEEHCAIPEPIHA